MGDDCGLDDLLDILNDDDDDFITDETQNKSKNEESSDIAVEDNIGEGNDEDEMARKLREMEEQVRLMKEKMTNKKKTTEIDMFSVSPKAGPKSPIKTNPLTEAEREKRPAVYVAATPDWCPGNMKTTTSRVLVGDEAAKLKSQLGSGGIRKEDVSLVRHDLADSEDEDNDGLNEFGKDIKTRMAHGGTDGVGNSGDGNGVGNSFYGRNGGGGNSGGVVNNKVGGWSQRDGNTVKLGQQDNFSKKNIMIERYSGLRISNPKLSQTQLNSAIGVRTVLTLSRLGESFARGEPGDWVTIGVLYYKAPPKTSSSGNDFSIWKLTDLKGEIKTVSLFLFGKAHKDHWKLPLNKVVGILNPKVLDDKKGANKGAEISISIDHPEKLLELGDSQDLAKCSHKKTDNTYCTNIVNKSTCDFCIYHVKQAYKASSGARPALQSSYSGGPGNARSRLMDKVDPKNQIFAGGQMVNDFKPLIGKKSAASKAKDNRLLVGLGGGSGGETRRMVDRVVKDGRDQYGRPRGALLSQEQKTLVQGVSRNVSEELGARLLAPTPGARAILSTLSKEKKDEEEKKNPTIALSAKQLILQHKSTLKRAEAPVLGRGSKDGEISLDISANVKSNFQSVGHAKALAILAMKEKKINKVDPNSAHRSINRTPEAKKKVMKRIRSNEDDDETNDLENVSYNPNKKAKTGSKSPKTVMVFGKEVSADKLDEIRNKKSINEHLVNEAELDAADKYFDKAEKRDEMEEKMLSTTEIKVKAVTCDKCKYTSFKSSDLCREAGHRVKVIDAVKRFFKCKDCSNRTMALTRLPLHTCGKCGGSAWLRAGMIGERKGVKLDSEMLSIRGNEETSLGTTTGSSNINL